MPRPIGWTKKDPDLGKLKIEARFFGSKLTFHRQNGRFEPWEIFTPDNEDWDTLNELAENKFRRGKVQEKQMRIIQARGEKL
ncbi:MAG TPA: hypothetical protein DIV79_00545 [Opitutae bacterium]|nr:hypothetical protein [Opitutaceae bacterium]HCR28490.1 hypothetical protein [Opitutae bacterium]|tara:strand:- start:70 stop:315 length:246 start_codon:yes stop_codon:yes gene_type:complete